MLCSLCDEGVVFVVWRGVLRSMCSPLGCTSCCVKSVRSRRFEPSLDALSSWSYVICSIDILCLRCVGSAAEAPQEALVGVGVVFWEDSSVFRQHSVKK